jgi:hypothetical protein
MGGCAFDSYLASIKRKIGKLNFTIDYLVREAEAEAQEDDPNLVDEVSITQDNLMIARKKIQALKDLFVLVKREWDDPAARVIGYVDWAPPFSVNVPPHGYMQDLSVIKLDKAKFKNLCGNVLSLGACVTNLAEVV